MLIKKEDYEKPEDGEYVAELTDVKEVTSAEHPEWGTSIRFIFKILEEPYVNQRVSGIVSATWRPGNKLDKWLTGLGVDSTNIGDSLAPENLKGRQARVYVETDVKSGYTNVKLIKPLRSTDSARIVSATPAPVAAPVATAPVVQPTVTNTPAPVVDTAPVAPRPVAPAPISKPRQIPF